MLQIASLSLGVGAPRRQHRGSALRTARLGARLRARRDPHAGRPRIPNHTPRPLSLSLSLFFRGERARVFPTGAFLARASPTTTTRATSKRASLTLFRKSVRGVTMSEFGVFCDQKNEPGGGALGRGGVGRFGREPPASE